MRRSARLALLGLFALLSCLLSATGVYDRAEEASRARLEAGRMKNVVLLEDAVRRAPAPAPAEEAPIPIGGGLPEAAPEGLAAVMDSTDGTDVRETTIPGGLQLRNATGYAVDVEQILWDGPQVRLPAEGPQILIIPAHGSEA